jgi:predicted MFS family arabinose efflux permease
MEVGGLVGWPVGWLVGRFVGWTVGRLLESGVGVGIAARAPTITMPAHTQASSSRPPNANKAISPLRPSHLLLKTIDTKPTTQNKAAASPARQQIQLAASTATAPG